MVSCAKFDLPNPPAQSNPEISGVFTDADLTVAQDGIDKNLKADNDNNVNTPMSKVSNLKNWPAGYDLVLDMQVSGDPSFSKYSTMETTIGADSIVSVTPDLFNGAIQQAMTKEPGVYPVYTRYAAYAVRDNSRMRIGALDKFYGEAQYNVTTLDPEKLIEDAYYLVGDFNNWDLTKAVKMENTSGEGVSPYDNPEFAVKMNVTNEQAAAGWTWKVVPQSTIASGSWAAALGCRPNEADPLQGILISAPEKKADAGIVNLEGDILITVNIEQATYSVNYAFEALWVGPSKSNTMPIETDNYINYQGAAYLGAGWVIGTDAGFTGLQFKQSEETEPVDSADGTVRSGDLATTGTTLRTPIKNTLYWVDVNLVQLNYTIAAIQTMGVVGNGNGWDAANPAPLTPSKDFKVWTGENVHIDGEFKINCNGAWDLDFGGGIDLGGINEHQFEAVYKGENMNKDGSIKPGDYTVTIDFSAIPYMITVK